ncbi:signal peptidase I [Chitinophaga sp. 30R24]|uniref:signal peptidase I n=1 Tax=Chitinophaga sp. 30R24 TaxID=3248838 RepID=UPI003B90A89F
MNNKKRTFTDQLLKRRYLILLAICCLTIIYIGLWWLIIFPFLIICYNLWLKTLEKYLYYKWKSIVVITGIFILVISIRLFLIEIYTVPSRSMEDEIFIGDNIVVSKLNYGPKLPQSPGDIPWLDMFFPEKKDSKIRGYRRLSGFTKIVKGDIIIFNKTNEEHLLIKRCVATPGDILQIINGDTYINGTKFNDYLTSKRHYSATISNVSVFKYYAEYLNFTYSLKDDSASSNSSIYLNLSEKAILEKSGCLNTITYVKSLDAGYPNHKDFQWTIDSLGPLTVPARGWSVHLDRRNFELYKPIIEYENKAIKFNFDSLRNTTYTFSQNYFFAEGDNHSNSSDSRYWGFIPESSIIGKAVAKLCARDKQGNFQFFKWL